MKVEIKTWDEVKKTEGVAEHYDVLEGPDGVWFTETMENDLGNNRVIEVEPMDINLEGYKGQYYGWNNHAILWTIAPWMIKDIHNRIRRHNYRAKQNKKGASNE
jgi:hypothetical protein